MSEQELLDQIVKHYKAYAASQIEVIERYLMGMMGLQMFTVQKKQHKN